MSVRRHLADQRVEHERVVLWFDTSSRRRLTQLVADQAAAALARCREQLGDQRAAHRLVASLRRDQRGREPWHRR
jgi:hypothetical protein